MVRISPELSPWNAYDYGVALDVTDHDGTGSDHGVDANDHTRKDDRTGTDAAPIKERRRVCLVLCIPGFGKLVVCQDGIRTNEHIMTDGGASRNEGTMLNPGPRPD
jgi:hypothetical protein